MTFKISIPNDVHVRVGLECGSVYNFSPEKEVLNHYYIVLNKKPKQNKELFLTRFTSKREVVLEFIKTRKLDIKTFVEVRKGECSALPKEDESYINCNFIHKYDIDTLVKLIDESNGTCYPKASNELIERIIEGLKSSRMIGRDVKKLL